MAYNGDNGTSGGYIYAENPFETIDNKPNSIALINARNPTQGTASFEILANTNLALTIPYQSYDVNDYDGGGMDATGNNFNQEYGRVWYGINTKSIYTGANQVLPGINYYNAPPSDAGYSWSALTPASNSTVNISGTLNIFVPKDSYLVMLITGPTSPNPGVYENTGMLWLTNLPRPDGFCFGAESKVLMANGEYRAIKDVKRGDVVMQDAETGSTAVVSREYSDIIMSNIVHIPTGLLGNKEEVLCTELHPIWFKNDDGDVVRIWAKDVPGVVIKQGCGEFYNLQFDEEGTFIVDGMKVDSLSPYHKYSPLPKELFIDETKYIPGRKVRDENDAFRNKPTLKIKSNRRKITTPVVDIATA